MKALVLLALAVVAVDCQCPRFYTEVDGSCYRISKVLVPRVRGGVVRKHKRAESKTGTRS